MGRLKWTLVERSFFILAFTILAAFGVAALIGIQGSELAENAITAVIATAVSLLLTLLVLGLPRSRSGRVLTVNLSKIAVFSIVLALIVIVHQIVSWGRVWEWDQVLHHENIALALVTFSLGILVALKLKGGMRHA